ncbi:MAG: cytochrome c biogenesis protein CcsA [Candidatus Heimdallarchaeota archaeon]
MFLLDFGIISFDFGLILLLLGGIFLFLDFLFQLFPGLTEPLKKRVKEPAFASLIIGFILFTGSFFYFVALLQVPDYGLSYVSSFVNLRMDFLLRIAAIWSGTAGSFFIWAVFSLLSYTIFRFVFRNDSEESLIHRASLMISFQMVILWLFTLISDPFKLNTITPSDGIGLNPVLTNIWNITHPPIILMGYSFCLVPMAIALARISLLREDSKIQRPLIMKIESFAELQIALAWWLLSLGVALGAYWAYTTLGWGGFWSWDPVQTSSLIPWLFITIYYHGSSIHKENPFLGYYFTCMSYVGVLLATLITRSRILESVHTFAPDENTFIILIVLIVTFTLPHIFAYINKANLDINLNFNELSIISTYKDTFLKLSYLTIILGTYVMITGIFLPFIYNVLSDFIPELTLILGPSISVGPSYFTAIFVCFGVILLVFSFFCKYYSNIGLKFRLGLLVVGVLAGIGFYALKLITRNDVANFFLPLMLLGLFGLIWNLTETLLIHRTGNVFQKTSQSLLHLSLLIIVLGIVTSGTLRSTDLIDVQDGSNVTVLDTNYEITVSNFNKTIPNDSPYLSIYEVQYELKLGSDIISEGVLYYRIDTIWGVDQKIQIITQLPDDIYLVLDFVFENDDTGIFDSATIQVRYIPLIHILWLGVILLLVSLIPLIATKTRRLTRSLG